LLWFVPATALRLRTPESAASTYTFNKHVIKHRFCAKCGIHTFGEGTDPKGNAVAAVNLRCIENLDLSRVPVHEYDVVPAPLGDVYQFIQAEAASRPGLIQALGVNQASHSHHCRFRAVSFDNYIRRGREKPFMTDRKPAPSVTIFGRTAVHPEEKEPPNVPNDLR